MHLHYIEPLGGFLVLRVGGYLLGPVVQVDGHPCVRPQLRWLVLGPGLLARDLVSLPVLLLAGGVAVVRRLPMWIIIN